MQSDSTRPRSGASRADRVPPAAVRRPEPPAHAERGRDRAGTAEETTSAVRGAIARSFPDSGSGGSGYRQNAGQTRTPTWAGERKPRLLASAGRTLPRWRRDQPITHEMEFRSDFEALSASLSLVVAYYCGKFCPGLGSKYVRMRAIVRIIC